MSENETDTNTPDAMPMSFDPELLRLIGEVTVEFSILEHFVAFGSCMLLFGGSAEAQAKAELVTARMSFAQKVDLLSGLYRETYGEDRAVADGLPGLCTALDRVRTERNWLQHSLWLFDGPNRVRALDIKFTRSGVDRRLRDLSPSDIRKHLNTIISARTAVIKLVDRMSAC